MRLIKMLPPDFDPYGKDAYAFAGPSNGAGGHVAPKPGEAKEAPVTVIRRTTE